MKPTPRDVEVEDIPTIRLVTDAFDEAKELVKLEVELAKEEAKLELAKVENAAIAFGIGAGASLLMLCMLAVALVFALGATAVTALLVAAGFLVIAGVAAFVGWKLLPMKPLQSTRRRLETDVRQLQEHIA